MTLVSRIPLTAVALGAAAALLGTACSSSSSRAPSIPAIAVASNPGGVDGTVAFYSRNIAAVEKTLTTGTNENIDFDGTGNLYQVGDGTVSAVRVFNDAAARVDAGSFDADQDREITGPVGKGLLVVDEISRVLVADVAGGDIKVFSSTAGQGAAALRSLTPSNAAWDVFYDATSDRLYAALTNGTLAIYDNFSTTVATATLENRLLIPVDDDSVQVSVNFHGVTTDGDVVYVTDVGSAVDATDGALFRFTDDGTVNGNIAPSDYRRIAGDQTQLGNPVDMLSVGSTVVIAEKSNDAILVFNSVGAAGDSNIAPSRSIAFTKPESVAFVVESDDLPADATDVTSPASVSTLAVVSNPSSAGSISRLQKSDLSTIDSFDTNVELLMTFTSPENAQYDTLGNLYLTADTSNNANTGTVMVINRFADRGAGSTDLGDTDRDVVVAAGLNAPKGIEIVQERGQFLVADAAAGAILAYSVSAGADAGPTFTVTDTGSASVWDLDYAPGNDRLFASGTGGDLLIYDNFFANGAAATPRTFRPAAMGVTSNLHGVIYVASSDQVIATDVADAGNADDGVLFVINNASGTSPTVQAAITGPAANAFGNPVDVAFDGSTVFIAEKSDDAVYAYNNALSLTATGSLEADLSAAFTKPESISLER